MRSISKKGHATGLFAGASLAVAACLLLAGCGGSDDRADGPQPDGREVASSSTERSRSGLTMTPISHEGFMGRIEDREIMPDPCPFLLDDTATAVSVSQTRLKRTTVSNEKCVWESKAAFIVTVTNQPIESAKPFSDYAYNLDNPPVLEEQDGPGSNPVAFYDPTWDESDPRIWAFGFEKSGRRVFISATGVTTSLGSLRAAANEVSEKMDSAPSIETQHWDIQPGFDLCSVWDQADLTGHFKEASEASAVSRPMECEWYISLPDYKGIKLRMGVRDAADVEYSKLAAIDRYKTTKIEGHDALVSNEVASTYRIDDIMVYKDGRALQINAQGSGDDLSVELQDLAKNFVSRIETGE